MAMATQLDPALRVDEGGTIRVGPTRVTLRSIVEAFKTGASAEEIVLRYPGLDLTDTYAAITAYLRNRTELDDLLAEEEREIEELQAQWDARPGVAELRGRLRAVKEARRSEAS